MIGASDHVTLPLRAEIDAPASTLENIAWLSCGDIGDFKLDLREILDWLIAIDSGDTISISDPTLGFDARRICRRGLLSEDLLETISSLRGDVARGC